MAAIPLGQYLQQQAAANPQPTAANPTPQAPQRTLAPSRPVEPETDWGAVAQQAAVKAAPKALGTGAKLLQGGEVGWGDVANIGAAVAGPVLGALGPEGKQAGQALSAGIQLAGTGKAIYDAASGAAAQAATGGLGTVMALWNIPQMVNSLFEIFNGNTADIRRAKRTRQAAELTGGLMGPIAQAQQDGNWARAFATPVGNSTVGDALASMIYYNQGGGWYEDTGHQWLPNPAFKGLYKKLEASGYLGSRLNPQTGQLDRREPSLGHVDGVGEIVAGGGLRIANPTLEADRAALRARHPGLRPEEVDETLHMRGRGEYLTGPQAWNHLISQVAGVPTVDVFDPALHRGIAMVSPGTTHLPANETTAAALEQKRRTLAPYGDPAYLEPERRAQIEADVAANNQAIDYLQSLGPEEAARVRAAAAQAALDREVLANAGYSNYFAAPSWEQVYQIPLQDGGGS